MQTMVNVGKILKSPNPIRRMGSDCVYCVLEQGVTCMMYFCRKKSSRTGKRELCIDGFRGKCPDYKP